MSGSDSAEKQPDAPETQLICGMAELTNKAPEVDDVDDELCKTPTRPENRIDILNYPPPAPRKKRPPPSSSTSKRIFTVHVILLQQTIDALFQQASGQPSRANKRRRIN